MAKALSIKDPALPITELAPLLSRIADALERLAPPAAPDADLMAHPAYLWREGRLNAVADFRAQPLDMLTGIDAQKKTLLRNTRRLAKGLPAHDTLLWGSRGMGKSSLSKSVVAKLQSEGMDIGLIEIARDALPSLPTLLNRIRTVRRPFVLFADDLSFEGDQSPAKALRSVLEGGAEARPDNARLYVTSNRRHIVDRDLAEQDSAINPRDVVDDKLALADRFGLSLGFHNCDQETYLAMVRGYAKAAGVPLDEHDALQWAVIRGARSGRVAWHYAQEIIARAQEA